MPFGRIRGSQQANRQGDQQSRKEKEVVDVDPTVESRLATLEEKATQFVTFRQVAYVALGLLIALLVSLIGFTFRFLLEYSFT